MVLTFLRHGSNIWLALGLLVLIVGFVAGVWPFSFLWAVVGALCPVHQYVRIGAHSYIGGGTTITQNVLPFSMTSAARDTHAYGMNKVGLERRGFSKERIAKIHHAYKVLLASKMNTSQALEKLRSESDRGEDVDMLLRFIEASERGVIK